MKFVLKQRPIVYILISLIIVCSLYFIIQKSISLSPSETVLAFDKEAKQGHIEESKKYVANEVLKALETGRFMVKTYSNIILEYNKGSKDKKVVLLSEKIVGDTATIKFEVTKEDGSRKEVDFKCIKEDGRWKILF